MLSTWIAVLAGGALGALGRFLLAGLANRPDGFPYGTLAVNLAGCLLIGALWQLLGDATATARAFVFVGVLGGFTTFSSFGLETVRMLQGGQMSAAAIYVLASNLLGLGMVAIGMAAARAINPQA